MKASGYSRTPLARKLGLKEGYIISVINSPDYYFQLFTDLPDKLEIVDNAGLKKNGIHYFVKEQKQLLKDIRQLKAQMKQDGMIWISWPKKASKLASDVTEDVIREIALENGLVDIKVCAVDEVWSALKLVIPVKDRR
jgi:hypothetical protein